MEIPERSGFKSDRDGPGVLSRNSADTPLLFDVFQKRSPQLKHRDVKTAKIRQSYFEINTYTTRKQSDLRKPSGSKEGQDFVLLVTTTNECFPLMTVLKGGGERGRVGILIPEENQLLLVV